MLNLIVATISPRRSAVGPAAELLALYIERAGRYVPCAHRSFVSEAKFLEWVADASSRTRPALLLAESRGQQLTSEELSQAVGQFQDKGTQQLILGIGPADGWSPAALKRADRTMSFGRITLPHELAAVIAAEQLYRALTIRAGHPYHSGH